MNPKKEAMGMHKIAALCILLTDALDEYLPGGSLAVEMKRIEKEVVPLLEEIYNIPEIRSGTYINDLANKVDAVIRKNFQQIPGNEKI